MKVSVRKIKGSEYDIEDLKRYMAIPAERKLQFLEEANAFFSRVMPRKNKVAWEKLKRAGW